MKMLDMDVSEMNELTKIEKNEALEFLEAGVDIICRTDRRDFYKVSKISDLKQCIKLAEDGVYDLLQFFVE